MSEIEFDHFIEVAERLMADATAVLAVAEQLSPGALRDRVEGWATDLEFNSHRGHSIWKELHGEYGEKPRLEPEIVPPALVEEMERDGRLLFGFPEQSAEGTSGEEEGRE